MTRVVLPSNVDTAQAIRIVAPQGKVLGSTAKTITLAQAKQMGILPQAKINQILPATAKVYTSKFKIFLYELHNILLVYCNLK